MVTAYYKGLADLVTVVASDAFSSIPLVLLLIMLSVVLRNTWIASLYNGAVILVLIFGLFFWPGYWRTVRGPAFQTVENEWIDAAKSYGQSPLTLMRKHIAPYVIGYLLIYASLGLGGIIISTSALSYLGLGITAPTPEWGRLVALGQAYVPTVSWHISIIPGLAIVLVVTGFNALGDGIRDAIDPESEGSTEGGTAAAGGGG
jgi:peptide/nickel transport system permease protein